jgi:peroxiredoxin family protein
MAGLPLYILLASGEHEKIQLAAMMASVAAVSDRPVEVFVSMDALAVFQRHLEPDQRYRGGALHDVFMTSKVPDAIELFANGRMLGELKMWACALILDLNHWDVETDLVEGLFDGPAGLTVFLAAAEAGQLVTI